MLWLLLGLPALITLLFWACCRSGAREDQAIEEYARHLGEML